tara:strand:- start:4351 stop:4830 length:480 start_codon:yes stop_codon:yes gene_type:complete
MADFETAFKLTSIFEGGISDNPADKGGMTAYGISQKHFPDWSGFKSIEDLGIGCNVELLVMSFYKREFWDKLKAELLDSQWIANELFNKSVNYGCCEGVTMLQRAVNLIKPDLLSIDGVIGNKTIDAVNLLYSMGLSNDHLGFKACPHSLQFITISVPT